MPELPEVETVKNAIAEVARAVRLTSILISGQKMRWPSLKILLMLTHGDYWVEARGKYIIMEIAQNNNAQYAMIIHLGMSGSVRIYPEKLFEQSKKHDHLMMVERQGKYLGLDDPRRFGGIQITPMVRDGRPLLKNMASSLKAMPCQRINGRG